MIEPVIDVLVGHLVHPKAHQYRCCLIHLFCTTVTTADLIEVQYIELQYIKVQYIEVQYIEIQYNNQKAVLRINQMVAAIPVHP